MQIRDINRIDKTTQTKKKKKTSDGDFSVFMESDNEEVSKISDVSSTSQISSILALQEVDNQDEVKRRNYDRGERLLDELQGYQKALLLGRVDEDTLAKMQKVVSKKRETSNDARLEAILDDIELRAAVESAKLKKAKQ